MAWNYGFTLCSAGRMQLLGDLEGTIKKLEITMLDLTPTVAATINANHLPGVELLYCIGEAMPQSVIDDWEKRCVNSYGPTGKYFLPNDILSNTKNFPQRRLCVARLYLSIGL